MTIKTPALRAKNVQKTFFQPDEVDILKGIDLDIFAGEAVAIMGASGEGKSTLLHILSSLEEPSSGELEILEQPVHKNNRDRLRNQHIGFIFQSFHLLQDSTALENVLLPASIGRQSTRKGSPAYQRALQLLDVVGLWDRMHFSTKLLSGGEKQRVAIARALCNDPQILFADEPSGNLDHKSSDQIHDLLLSITKEQGKSLIVVTHDSHLASLCDRTLILKNGKILNY